MKVEEYRMTPPPSTGGTTGESNVPPAGGGASAAPVVPSPEDLNEEDLTNQWLAEREGQKGEADGFGVQKKIAVIFATIGGFEVASNASMDDIEEVHIRKNQLDIELDRIISKYGGLIDKIIRNFFMATFGTKVTNQDDPACAILAGLEMIQAIENFPGAGIQIGINSGPAWVGMIGTGGANGFTDATVIGDTVNLAARLKSKAGLNQMVVSPATYHLTQHLFVYEALPPVLLKGITAPVPIYAVTGKKPEVERITVVKETQEDRQKRLQAAIPPHLREKINATRGTLEGERRMVTMLYSDLSGFTALSEKFKGDPGKIAQLMDMCHHALGQVIYKYEGVIDQIVGDELMAIFGAPIIHEDDPERAVCAGLEMLEEIKPFSDRMAVEMGMPPLNVHIGVNTGRVSIGHISTDATAKMDYTVIGEPVELAEKLEDISETGEMVVGERTYRLTRALFDYEPLKPVEVSGKLVPIYKVLGKKADPQLKRGVAALNQVEIVARESELDSLKTAANLMFAPPSSPPNWGGKRGGHFVCTIGQAGLGKSRLKREFKAHLGERVSWLEGTGFGHTQQTAYSVFIAVMKAYLDIHENDSDEEITEKLIFKVKNLFRNVERSEIPPSPPFQRGDTGGISEEDLSEEIIPYIGNQLLSLRFEGERADKVRYLDADGRRRRTFAAVKDLLAAESKRRPVVLALDDLHWIDPLSLELIFFLMETVINQPILLFCLYRPERTDPCWTIGEQAAIRIPKDFTQITLSHLSPEASRELLERLLTLEGADELKQRMLEKVGGNPFYMEEVLRSLIDDKVIEKVKPDDPNDSRWVVKGDVQGMDVPDSLEQVMGARIDKLPDEPKVVLQRGAVIGRTFEVDILQEITPSPQPTPGPSRGAEWGEGRRVSEDLENHLSRLTAMDMIDLKKPPTDPPEYIFEHIITHDIAYKSIPGVRRRRLHTQVGNCMETKHREHLERMYEQLAQHYHNGSDATKAAIYLARAGKKAKSQYNNRVALTFYQQGLEHMKQLREDLPEERIGMHEGLGDVYTIRGEFDAAIENYTEALQSVRAPVHRAALKRKIANVHEKRAEYDAAMATLNTALEELKIQPDPVEEARIYNAIGSIHYKKGDFPSAIEITTRALKLVEDTTDHDVIAAIDKNLGNYYLRTRNADRGKEYYLKAIERAGQIGDKMLIAQLYNNLGVAGEIMGQMDTALENHQKSLELNEQLGYAAGMTTSYINLGMVYSKLEDFDRALEYYGKALTIAQRTGAQERVAHIQSNMGAVYWKRGDFDRATEHNRASLEIRERIGDALGVAHCYINLVTASLGKNDIEAAEMYAMTALGTALQIDFAQGISSAYNNIGLVEQRKGAWDLAKGYFQEAAEIAEGTGAKKELAEACRNIGEVYLEVKNIEGAKASFQKAIALYEQLRVRSEVEKIKGFLQKCER